MSNQGSSDPVLDVLAKARAAMAEFVRKVDVGEAKSIRSYNEFKDMIKEIDMVVGLPDDVSCGLLDLDNRAGPIEQIVGQGEAGVE